MIGMLTGRVESVETDTALIDVGGVGYEVRMSATDLSRLHAGQDTRVFTYMNLSQDAITLHGFLDRDAKKTFLQLIKVSGIGPKVAQSLLSTLTPSQLAHAIADNDATALAKAPGLGKKGAQKIILELKGSIDLSQIEGASAQAATSKSPVDTSTEQVVEGLISLGWRQSRCAWSPPSRSATSRSATRSCAPMFSKALSDSHGSRPSCNCSWTRPANAMCHRTIFCSPALLAWAKPRWP